MLPNKRSKIAYINKKWLIWQSSKVYFLNGYVSQEETFQKYNKYQTLSL